MAILIEDVDMPSTCSVCPFSCEIDKNAWSIRICELTAEDVTGMKYGCRRGYECPLKMVVEHEEENYVQIGDKLYGKEVCGRVET